MIVPIMRRFSRFYDVMFITAETLSPRFCVVSDAVLGIRINTNLGMLSRSLIISQTSRHTECTVERNEPKLTHYKEGEAADHYTHIHYF